MSFRIWKRKRGVKGAQVAKTRSGDYLLTEKGPWLRIRSKAENAAARLRAELRRCGWDPKHLKVREFGGAFYLNLGVLRGLDPELALQELRTLPDKCGVRRILRALTKLPERVEAGEQSSEVAA